MGVTSLGRHTRPACNQGSTRSLKLCEECRFNSYVWVFFIPWVTCQTMPIYGQLWRHISHMGEMRDADWSREILLRSDWLLPKGAIMTTCVINWPGVRSRLLDIDALLYILRRYQLKLKSMEQTWSIKDLSLVKITLFLEGPKEGNPERGRFKTMLPAQIASQSIHHQAYRIILNMTRM